MTEKENNIPEVETEIVEKQEKSEVKDESQKKRWYVVHTYSGHENKVKVNLEKRIEYMNMGEKIFRVEVPQKTITQVRSGKKTKIVLAIYTIFCYHTSVASPYIWTYYER